ncbi:MAG: hypothetical protein H7145_17410 [Akkermansiaceae bacterium]|nr:hypothetical protein [Armatimonadota bacterium]
MKTFVLIFRQGDRPLSTTDKQRRSEETSSWARRQNGAGHKLTPHILGPETAYCGQVGATGKADVWPITALLFLEAYDLSDATQVAGGHPALRYGANVEIRAWSPPVPGAPPANTPGTP